jgi:hypothetical protein
MLFYYIFDVYQAKRLINVDFPMVTKRNFDKRDFLSLLSRELLSTGEIARKIRCDKVTALKYLRELKAEKRVIETRISSTSNVWSLRNGRKINYNIMVTYI